MTDATTAAKAIQDYYTVNTRAHDNAGVVLARINKAIEHTEEALRRANARNTDSDIAGRLRAALACLRNEDT